MNTFDLDRKIEKLMKCANASSAIQFIKDNIPDNIIYSKEICNIACRIDTPDIKAYIKTNYPVIYGANNCFSRKMRSIFDDEKFDTKALEEEFEEIFRNIKREGAEDLLNYIKNETDFYTAPASAKYHSSHPGGLIAHSINVYRNLVQLCESPAFSRFGFKYSDETLAIVALLHDFCKIFNYELCKDRQGKEYYAYTDHEKMGHGEYSVFLAQAYIKLTYDEMCAIRWHMGFSEQNQLANVGTNFEKCPLAFMLATADMMSTYYDEQTP